MRNIVLGFNIVGTLFVVLLGLTIFMFTVFASLPGALPLHLIWLTLFTLVIFFIMSLVTAYGLKRYKGWSYLLGGIESILLIIVCVVSFILSGFDSVLGHLLWLSVPLGLMVELKGDYARRPIQEVSHA